MPVYRIHLDTRQECTFSKLLQVSRIYHQSLMQTEKSQPEGELIMPETRFTEFPPLSVYPRVGISRSAWETKV